MKEIVNSFFDNVVILDLNTKYKDLIFNNNKILNLYELGGSGSGKSFTFFKKTLEVKKYFKYFKKKNISFFIGEVTNIKKYKKTLLKDILITTNSKAYILSHNKKDLVDLEKIIKRYTKNYSIKQIDRDYYLEINCSIIKNKFIKDKLYYIKDSISDVFEIVSNLLLK